MIKGTTGALVGGVMGAAVWAGVTYFSRHELGFMAWAVGGLTGLGMLICYTGKRPVIAGVVSAVIACGAVAGGKVCAAHFFAKSHLKEAATSVSETDALSALAMEIADRQQRAGLHGYTHDGNFSPEVVRAAQSQWSTLSVAQRQAYTDKARELIQTVAQQAEGVATTVALISSISLFDLIWVSLACGTAFVLGRRGGNRFADEEVSNRGAKGAKVLGGGGSPLPGSEGFWARLGPGDEAGSPDAKARPAQDDSARKAA